MSYETLNQVQGDKMAVTTQSHGGEGWGEGNGAWCIALNPDFNLNLSLDLNLSRRLTER
jgi:hypothetical protein